MKYLYPDAYYDLVEKVDTKKDRARHLHPGSR